MICAMFTEAGCGRDENQDRVAADPRQGTFVVADGMGGLTDAAATAQAVVDRLPAMVAGCAVTMRTPNLVPSITAVTAQLNDQVRRAARYGAGNAGAATALLLIRARCALTVHLGDSRIYLARRGRTTRLTEDHALSTGELTQFIGMDGTITPGVSVHPLRPGDRLLLCTDGLVQSLDDAAVGTMLSGCRDVTGACRALVRTARMGGATDDISVIAVDYRPGGGGR